MVLCEAITECNDSVVARAEGIALIIQTILKYFAKNIIQDKKIAIGIRRAWFFAKQKPNVMSPK